MLVYSSKVFHGKRNGHGYEYYTRDAICGDCGNIIGEQSCYNNNDFYFNDRNKNNYIFCPFCGNKLYNFKRKRTK